MKTYITVLLAFAVTLAPSLANAAGFRLVETDNAGQGQAHAIVASVSDAASVYYNPAAMVDIGGYSAKAGMQIVDPKATYSGQGTSLDTSNTSFAIPHLYVVKNFQEAGMAVGFGLFVNFGTGTTWPIDGPFRYVATDTQLRTHTFNLNVAKKFGDSLSVAAGIDYMTTNVRYDAMYPFGFFQTGAADGFQILEGDGTGFGFNAAVLFKPTDKLRIGASYRSSIKTTISGDMKIQNFPSSLQPLLALAGISGDDYTSSAELDLEYPAIIVLGIAYQATERLLVEVDFDYTGWSSYDELNFKFDRPLAIPGAGVSILPATSNQEKNWDNVIAYRVGAAYKYNDQLTLRGGFYLDPTPIPDDTFEPRLPGHDRKLVSLGFGYKAGDNFSIDAAYAYLWTGSRSVDNNIGATTFSSIDGDYETTIHIFGVSVGYQF